MLNCLEELAAISVLSFSSLAFLRMLLTLNPAVSVEGLSYLTWFLKTISLRYL